MARPTRKDLLGHLLGSIRRRRGNMPAGDGAKADMISASRMAWQDRVATDPNRYIAVLAPRRAGKSWLVLSLAMESSLRHPGAHWVIVGLTRPSVKVIYWQVMKRLNQMMELGVKFHGTDLTATFPNGSIIRFTGAENRGEIEKLRGGQYDGVVVDECKSFQPEVFRELLQEVVRPALMDRTGKLILIGTPGDILAGPFYEATCTPPVRTAAADGTKRWSNRKYGDADDGVPALWSKHLTSLRENTEVVNAKGQTLWEDALEYKRLMGWADNHQVWLREYLAIWTASDNRLVYSYQPHRNTYETHLPEGHEWIHVMGFDLGYQDSDACVVWAYSPTCPGLYEIYSQKRPKQNIAAMAGWLLEIRDTYSPDAIVADFGALGKKILESIADDYGLVAEPAEKREKLTWIANMNADFDRCLVHLLPGSALGEEMLVNRWLEASLGTEKLREDDRTPNDLCDAALYAYRYAHHKRWQPRKPTHEVHSREWWAEYKRQEFQRAVREVKAAREDDFSGLDRDWWSGS